MQFLSRRVALSDLLRIRRFSFNSRIQRMWISETFYLILDRDFPQLHSENRVTRHYSARMLAALMTGHQRSISAF